MPSASLTLDCRGLLHRAGAGDQIAASQLYHHYRNLIARAIGRLVTSATDIEDLVQDVFVKAFRFASSYSCSDLSHEQAGAHLGAWLRTIARNQAVDFLRRRQLVYLPLAELAAQGQERWVLEFPLPDGEPQPDQLVDAQLVAERVRAAVARLPLPRQQVIELVHFDHRTMEEAAQLLGLPVCQVKIRLFRARNQLHQLLSTDPSSTRPLRKQRKAQPTR